VNYPGALNEAVTLWLARNGQGGLADKAARLSQAYRKGGNSSQVSLAAYVATRVPATFAANGRVHEALRDALPGFAPQSLLDIGTGPGTASWAALAAWPSLGHITQCEQDTGFANLAAVLNGASGLPALADARLLRMAEKDVPADVNADLAVASYVLAELPLQTTGLVAQRLWARAQQVLVLIEPGTPQGFARLKAARTALLGCGALVIAPCTHQLSCPLAETDWCHFKTRVQRTREHMHAKQAVVPFEDEAFSYLVVSRNGVSPSGGRILSPPDESKVRVALRLCETGAIKQAEIASRNKPAYKRAKKARWGDRWE
jgi:ribosomal protein RSM22 (predicted rRNA methylase)